MLGLDLLLAVDPPTAVHDLYWGPPQTAKLSAHNWKPSDHSPLKFGQHIVLALFLTEASKDCQATKSLLACGSGLDA